MAYCFVSNIDNDNCLLLMFTCDTKADSGELKIIVKKSRCPEKLLILNDAIVRVDNVDFYGVSGKHLHVPRKQDRPQEDYDLTFTFSYKTKVTHELQTGSLGF